MDGCTSVAPENTAFEGTVEPAVCDGFLALAAVGRAEAFE
jgi:hypothetical protein